MPDGFWSKDSKHVVLLSEGYLTPDAESVASFSPVFFGSLVAAADSEQVTDFGMN